MGLASAMHTMHPVLGHGGGSQTRRDMNRDVQNGHMKTSLIDRGRDLQPDSRQTDYGGPSH